MPKSRIQRSTPVERTARVLQLEGLFDIPPTQRSEVSWEVDLPIEKRDWNLGLIVGPSGSGKTTIAKNLFGKELVSGFDWPAEKSIVDAFPQRMSIKEITALLSSVGFSSPPSWLRPFAVLSNGEQFRVTLARALAESGERRAEGGEQRAEVSGSPLSAIRPPHLVVIDEFTSVVDRTVARIGSAAVAKTVRRIGCKLIAVSCHYDIVEWLGPDWIYEPHTGRFSWRSVRPRPRIELEIRLVRRTAWRLFHHHHYLDTNLNPSARCYVGFLECGMRNAERGMEELRVSSEATSSAIPRSAFRVPHSDVPRSKVPAVFTAVLPFPHPTRSGWREHRTVCLPDFQGVGIGNAMSEFVAGMFRATGRPYRSVTSNPAMIFHRARSKLWKMTRPPSRTSRHSLASFRKTPAYARLTASFEYVGPARTEDAVEFGLIGRK